MDKRKNPSPLELDIRRRVEAKYEERNALLIHLASYAGVNVLLWIIWLSSSGGFPWPLFVSMGWGIGLFAHLLDYYSKHGGGAQKREARIDEEVRRHLERFEARESEIYDDEAMEGAAVYGLDDVEPRRLRLTDDGELTSVDAYDAEADGGERERRRD